MTYPLPLASPMVMLPVPVLSVTLLEMVAAPPLSMTAPPVVLPDAQLPGVAQLAGPVTFQLNPWA